ncbi:MAG: rhomboid family intramembrane serine protease [Planctomycetes bacterium]|nr:rhomboid family intramembrane serine protease [Planctomycetota bacterium]
MRDPEHPSLPLLLLRYAPITLATCVLAIVTTAVFWYTPQAEFVVMTPAAFGAQPWRLLTSTLAHVNAIHILFNLMFFAQIGLAVETRMPPLRYVLLLVTLAAGSGAAEFAVGFGGVGLSGVLYGLFGLTWYANTRVDAYRGLLPAATIRTLVGWFFLCLVATRLGLLNIGNTAHGVGCALGWVAAWAGFAPARARNLRLGLYGGFVAACLAAGAVGRQPLLEWTGQHELALVERAWADQGGVRAFQAELDALDELAERKAWSELEPRCDEVLARFDRGADTPPMLARVYYIRGFARLQLDELEGALADARRARELHADEPGVNELAAACDARLGR